MATLIKDLLNGRKVISDNGKFDAWCVYIVEQNNSKQAPFDVTYFTELKQLSSKYYQDKVYNDFVRIYERTTRTIDPIVINLIDQIIATYNTEDQVLIEQWFSVIYGGMIAEENKQNAILKKRVKRLGMHQVLQLNMHPSVAARFSYGKRWRELDQIMKSYNF